MTDPGAGFWLVFPPKTESCQETVAGGFFLEAIFFGVMYIFRKKTIFAVANFE